MKDYMLQADYEDNIIHEIKLSEANKYKQVRTRDTNLYKRLWYKAKALRQRDDDIGDKPRENDESGTDTGILRYNSGEEKSIKNINVEWNEKMNELKFFADDNVFFPYLNEYPRLRYIKANNFKNEPPKIKKDLDEYYLELNHIMMNNEIENLRNTNDPINYSKKSGSHDENLGEFGVIMANKSKRRGRPSNTFKKKMLSKMTDKEEDLYQPLEYKDELNMEDSYSGYTTKDDKYLDNLGEYDGYQNDYYQNIDQQMDDHTIKDHKSLSYYDKTEYYPEDGYEYYDVSKDAQNQFRKCHDSWSHLYNSMSTSMNHNEAASDNFDAEEQEALTYQSAMFQAYQNEPVCMHCGTKETSLWRRLEGKTVCNACGLYYKMHGVKRPISLKKSSIKKRRRMSRRRTLPDEN